jgi:ferric-dicitrate binding protein FerR (iron transport regulator)
MSLQEAKYFVAHFVSGGYTPEEYATFLQWLRGASFDELNVIADEHESLHGSWSLPASEPSPEWVTMLEGKLDELGREVYEAPVRHVGIRRMIHRRVWVGAASVVVLLSAGAILYTQRSHVDNRLTKNGHGAAAPVLSQVMENPAGGGQKELVLADGSKIWLNAASTLKYPAVFTGAERVVELSGEAYFEVTKSAGKPFRVQIKDAEVEVLGTHFNIMAYDNEPVSKTTLIDGAVRVESGTKQMELKPGDQALVHYAAAGSGEAEIEVVKVDADAALGWRKGNIDLKNADVHTVMRALKRYYNIDIQYAQTVPDTKLFTGGLILQDGLQHNLGIVGGFFELHFKTDGKLVTVTR